VRATAFAIVAYASLLGESALGWLLRRAHGFFGAPELGLFIVVYLGLSGRGGPVALTCAALAIGYLRDLLVGAPRGIEALSFALCALVARALHGRVFVDRFAQLAVVCASFAALHGLLLMLFGPEGSSWRALVPVVVSALCIGPIVLRLLRRLDHRVSPTAAALRMDGELSGGLGDWR
jgi:rod shape-determining protein MreD